MTGIASKFVSSTSFLKGFLKPFKALDKKVHVPKGHATPGGAVVSGPAGSTPSPSFRPTGKSAEDKSGFPVQHLGDKK